MLLMNKENCALKLFDEIILYYNARSKKHKINKLRLSGLFIVNGVFLNKASYCPNPNKTSGRCSGNG